LRRRFPEPGNDNTPCNFTVQSYLDAGVPADKILMGIPFDGLNFWTYEDAQSIAVKTKFAREQHLRGAFIFEEPDELPDGSLLNAVFNGIHGRSH
jgi:GH18 family chitinase